MDLRACLRCGSDDLAVAGVADGIAPEGPLQSWVCRRCGLQAQPMLFQDPEGLARFREDRAALWKPGLDPPALPEGAEPPPRPRSALTRGLAALVGFAFVTAAVLVFFTAARLGGNAWWVMGPSGLLALLLGLPFVALARQR